MSERVRRSTLQIAIEAHRAREGQAQFSAAIKQIQTDVKAAATSLSDLDSRVARLGTTSRTVTGSIRRFAGAFGGIALAKTAITTVADFERQLTLAGAISRSTAEQIKAAREELIKIGQTTIFDPTVAAKGLKELTKSGLDLSDSLIALRGTLGLAAVGELDLVTATKGVVSTLSQFSLAATESSRVANILAQASFNTIVNVEDLIQSFKFIGPAANQFGKSIEEVTAALTVLGSQGLKQTIAGRGLQRALVELSTPTPKAIAELRRLELTVEQINPEFNDLTTIFKRFRDANIDATAASRIFGVEALKIGATLAKLADEMGVLTEEYAAQDNVIDNVVGAMEDDLRGSIDKLLNSFKSLFLVLGDEEGLGFFVKLAVDALRLFVNALSELARGVQKFISPFIEVSKAIVSIVAKTGEMLGFAKSIDEVAESVDGISANKINNLNEAFRRLQEKQGIINQFIDSMGELREALSSIAAVETVKLDFGITRGSEGVSAARAASLNIVRSQFKELQKDLEEQLSLPIQEQSQQRILAIQILLQKLIPVLEEEERRFAEINELISIKKSLLDQVTTPSEKIITQQAQLNRLQEVGLVNDQEFNRIKAGLENQLIELSIKGNTLIEERSRLLEESKTILMEAAENQIILNQLVAANLVTEKERVRIQEFINEQTEQGIDQQIQLQIQSRKAGEALEGSFREYERSAINAGLAVSDVFSVTTRSFEDATISVINGTKSMSDAFKEMANIVVEELQRIVIKLLIISAIRGIAGLVTGQGFSGFGAPFSAFGGGFLPSAPPGTPTPIPSAQEGDIRFQGPRTGFPVILHGDETVRKTKVSPEEPGAPVVNVTININALDPNTADKTVLQSLARNSEKAGLLIANESMRNPNIRFRK